MEFRSNPPTQTLIDKEGKILFYSLEDFKGQIVEGNDCFICGVSRGVKEFNDEHILPEWLLRRYNLYNNKIFLPNGASVKYGKYKIPCSSINF